MNILFFAGFVNAQEQNELQSEKAKVILVIQSGAVLYSADSKFNQQIIENQIKVSENTVDKLSFSKSLIVLSAKNIKSSHLNHHQRYSKVEKKTQKTKLLNPQTTVHKKREVDFLKLAVKQHPSSNHFSSNQKNNTDYITQRTYREDYFNAHFVISYFSTNLALNLLDKQKIIYYNNKSINFCHSQIFYTRPPPFKV
ncbi:hypothetical protein [Chryseobacterium turcicum]|uniref:Uncharacterized protein n=1 Tax=Chryseobacterium turcicum TaxID=2898076 RepID=A0A9Q3V3Q2_9FLAO|nr:hypothetical protein [Chryseobacterium turcicum]MCD1117787.1 hypothetical protein [Chryseobacterium turcicum]